MSLLDDLRATAEPERADRSEWWLTERALLLLLPEVSGVKVAVNRGAVEVSGHVPRRWFTARLDPAEHEHGPRLAHLGLGTNRDDAAQNRLAAPFSAWLPPEPGALGAWVAGVVLSARRDWPQTVHRAGKPRTP